MFHGIFSFEMINVLCFEAIEENQHRRFFSALKHTNWSSEEEEGMAEKIIHKDLKTATECKKKIIKANQMIVGPVQR